MAPWTLAPQVSSDVARNLALQMSNHNCRHKGQINGAFFWIIAIKISTYSPVNAANWILLPPTDCHGSIAHSGCPYATEPCWLSKAERYHMMKNKAMSDKQPLTAAILQHIVEFQPLYQSFPLSCPLQLLLLLGMEGAIGRQLIFVTVSSLPVILLLAKNNNDLL